MVIPLFKPWAVAPLVSLVLLLGVWAERQLFHLPHGDEGTYHARVRAIVDMLPYSFGDWIGDDVEIPRAAETLLRPNALLGRRFSNATAEEHATLILVQCGDARDMRGHYPPNCYPGQGWELRREVLTSVVSDGLPVPLTVYRFTKESIDEYSEIEVYNFFVLPNGAIEADWAGLHDAAEDPRTRRYGAAQLQITLGPLVARDRRAYVVRTMIEIARPAIDAIRGGDAR